MLDPLPREAWFAVEGFDRHIDRVSYLFYVSKSFGKHAGLNVATSKMPQTVELEYCFVAT